ncbi:MULTISPECIES: sigma-70 family RNA polymerase sigma factor [Inquilinus]|uniref:RNA polymerase sigma-70 factor (ECF subfamily) n=1 Tax=Inquilinus ginsengisoli TaxID=363840 RepID=A0ABU1JVN8_9PROT|nr:sigma-70 family RNA polymerase sigma factor [Inquilinus ginsengisoli]MDR6292689.1 RNA polymerase sigma-70 factor (ECF subfamily) [Inquilinus ginsengisoli]HMG50174.1 sigma-70 family RNA polymerase sigma factor [Inquilinus sp.]
MTDSDAGTPPGMRDGVGWSTLMTAAQAGDGVAYRRLLTEITPYLRALARRSLRRPADAEDAVQDVLLTLHSIRRTYDPARPFQPWLVAIARRRIVDRVRIQIRTTGRETAIEPFEETFAAPETNEWGMESDSIALRRAIADLPPGQRQAVELLKLKDMSLKEASAASGASVPALKVAMHRALKALKGVLGPK